MTHKVDSCYESSAPPLLIVLSGPSGVGKDAALNELRRMDRTWHFAETATTRSMRPGETQGKPYIFMDSDAFTEQIESGELLEYAQVYGNWYGVPKGPVRDALANGLDVIVKVDVQGAATIRKLAPETVSIFLVPASLDELKSRLRKRATETEADMELRTAIVEEEMEQMASFDYKVVNKDEGLSEAVAAIDAIITAEKRRIPPRQVSI